MKQFNTIPELFKYVVEVEADYFSNFDTDFDCIHEGMKPSTYALISEQADKLVKLTPSEFKLFTSNFSTPERVKEHIFLEYILYKLDDKNLKFNSFKKLLAERENY